MSGNSWVGKHKRELLMAAAAAAAAPIAGPALGAALGKGAAGWALGAGESLGGGLGAAFGMPETVASIAPTTGLLSNVDKLGKYAQVAQMMGAGQQPQPPSFMPAQPPQQAPQDGPSATQLGAGLYPYIDEQTKRRLALAGLLGAGNYGY